MAACMTRSEPGTATAAIAVTLGVGTLSKQLGLAPLPPGLVQLFGPVAEAALRFTSESVRRGVFVLLILLCPMWGAAHVAAADSGPAFEQAIELPSAVFAILAPAVAILWAVNSQGACVALAATRRTRDVRSDGQVRWSTLACTHLKSGRGARAARPEPRGRFDNST
jgi:hypothetical protein